jgi:hypothetical protein
VASQEPTESANPPTLTFAPIGIISNAPVAVSPEQGIWTGTASQVGVAGSLVIATVAIVMTIFVS